MAIANAINKEMPAGVVIGTTDTQALTNKTFDASLNTLSNVDTTMFAANIIDTDVTLAADSDTRLATQKATKAYVDSQVGGFDTLAELTDVIGVTYTAGSVIIGDGTDSMDQKAISGDATLASTGALTVASIGGDAVVLGGAFTTSGAFTTTLTATANTSVTLPTTGTLATLAGTETLTNKTFDAASNTLSNIATSMFAANVVDTDGTLAANSDTRLGSQKAIKTYVDNVANGLKWKDSVTVASTADLTLSGEQTIDGILTSADRILVKNQSTGAENGIYVTAAGAWARSADYATGDAVASTSMFIEEGTVNADTSYTCTNDAGSDIVGTDALVYAQFDGGSITAGNGLTRTGNALLIDTAITADLSTAQTLTNKTLTTPTIASFTNATHDHSNAAGGGQITLTTGVTGVLPEANGGTNQSTYATGDVLYASASNTLSKLAVGSNTEVMTLAGGVPTWAAPAAGGLAFSEVTANTAMAVNTGYIVNKAATAGVMTLPATAAVGDIIRIAGKGATGWQIAQNASQVIHVGTVDSTTGASGTVDSSAQYDSIEIICVTANTDFVAMSSFGNLDVL